MNSALSEIGMTKEGLINKFGKEKTMLILNSLIFQGATVGLNDKNEQVYYHIDIKQALNRIK